MCEHSILPRITNLVTHAYHNCLFAQSQQRYRVCTYHGVGRVVLAGDAGHAAEVLYLRCSVLLVLGLGLGIQYGTSRLQLGDLPSTGRPTSALVWRKASNVAFGEKSTEVSPIARACVTTGPVEFNKLTSVVQETPSAATE